MSQNSDEYGQEWPEDLNFSDLDEEVDEGSDEGVGSEFDEEQEEREPTNLSLIDNLFLRHLNEKSRELDTVDIQHTLGKKDIQGIPWGEPYIANGLTREAFRAQRVDYLRERFIPEPEQHAAYADLQENLTRTDKDGEYYEFRLHTASVPCDRYHYQLFHVVVAPNKHEVYHLHSRAVHVWRPLSTTPDGRHGSKRKVISLLEHNMSPSCLDVSEDLLCVGGLGGELVCHNVRTGQTLLRRKIGEGTNCITNAVQIVPKDGGCSTIVCSNNDNKVRLLDCPSFEVTHTFSFPWCVNHTTMSPADGRLLCVGGDTPNVLIYDTRTGAAELTLEGHIDFTFATAWHPDGTQVATGNQDRTARVWDLRRTDGQSLAILESTSDAMRSLKYTSCGTHLVASESLDFVHIYDCESGYKHEQVIDFFGEIAGMTVTPDDEFLYIGTMQRHSGEGGILEYRRKHPPSPLDAILSE